MYYGFSIGNCYFTHEYPDDNMDDIYESMGTIIGAGIA
jgi:hypothetical protein